MVNVGAVLDSREAATAASDGGTCVERERERLRHGDPWHDTTVGFGCVVEGAEGQGIVSSSDVCLFFMNDTSGMCTAEAGSIQADDSGVQGGGH